MSVSYDFDDRTVIVTGGSSGIGRAVARLFGDADATVIVADVREDPKDLGEETPTHEAIADAGGTAEYVETDVSERSDVASVVEAARAHGGVDVMVNNAGLQIANPLGDVSPADLGDMLDVNVKGVFYGVQAAADDMREREDPGVIVNTASISSNLAQHGQIPYDATKGAVRMITRGAALELAEHGIRVNAVAPGQIATEFAEGWTEEARAKSGSGGLLKPVPLGRAGAPEDVAPAFAWLASEDAGYVTGELLHVDGGWQVG